MYICHPIKQIIPLPAPGPGPPPKHQRSLTSYTNASFLIVPPPISITLVFSGQSPFHSDPPPNQQIPRPSLPVPPFHCPRDRPPHTEWEIYHMTKPDMASLRGSKPSGTAPQFAHWSLYSYSRGTLDAAPSNTLRSTRECHYTVFAATLPHLLLMHSHLLASRLVVTTSRSKNPDSSKLQKPPHMHLPGTQATTSLPRRPTDKLQLLALQRLPCEPLFLLLRHASARLLFDGRGRRGAGRTRRQFSVGDEVGVVDWCVVGR